MLERDPVRHVAITNIKNNFLLELFRNKNKKGCSFCKVNINIIAIVLIFLKMGGNQEWRGAIDSLIIKAIRHRLKIWFSGRRIWFCTNLKIRRAEETAWIKK